MLSKTRGIVFRFVRYGDTSIIVNIFTEVHGMQAYIVNGVRSKTGKGRIALFQPLTLLDMVVYHRHQANINRIKEVKCYYPYHSIPIDIRKSSIAIFLNEMLNKTVKEESQTDSLFEFLSSSLEMLDRMQDHFENFHLVFLFKLSRYLGFGAHNVNEVLGPRMASPAEEKLLEQLIQSDYAAPIEVSSAQRRVLLELVLKFYADHLDSLGEIKSVQVLKEVLG
ncbi:MAG: DNA repair protein RecO [Bacteroidia bacterium]|nr:DNA repair protein RecO [Bacteroidia bacterium]